MDMKLVGWAGLIGGTLFLGAVEAAVLKVPQQYTTIQAAVNAAQEGDTVRVAAGTYTERVLIAGKAIALVGAGAEQTTIDAAQTGRPITVSNTGAGQVTVGGFTLRNGLVNWDDTITPIGTGFGGGVYVQQTNVTVRDNVITNNLGCIGTALATFEATITMTRNRVENNPGSLECGQQAMFMWTTRGAESLVVGNVIQNHNITGLYLNYAGKLTVSNNIFRNNLAAAWEELELEHGALSSFYTELTLTNNLFSGNHGSWVGGAFLTESGDGGEPVRISGNSFVGNSAGEFGTSSLVVLDSVRANAIIKANQFDESAERLVVSCTWPIVVDATNVFVQGRESLLEGGCASE